jgi:hypothetical protein
MVNKVTKRRKTHQKIKIAITITILITKKKKKKRLMNNQTSKKNMNTCNTQLTLLVIRCLLEVDTSSSRKSQKNFKEKKQLENHKSRSNLLKQK